jgi:SAM-dependent methyltransferase
MDLSTSRPSRARKPKKERLKDLNKLDFKLLYKYAQKPVLFEKSTASLWDDEHISKGMLKAHLDPVLEAASRKHSFIDNSVDWIIKFTGIKKGNKILDLGCGPGLYTERFSKQGYKVTGVDFSHRSVEYAKQQAFKYNLDVNYIYQNYLTIDFLNEYNLVILIYCDLGVFSEEEIDVVLKKVYASLKPGGYFIFDLFTPVKYLQYKDSHNTWDYQESGYWRPYPYISLYSQYIYPENNTFLDQFVVMDDLENIEVYRNWNHCYSKEDIAKIIKNIAFKELIYFSDVTGKEYSDSSETICVVAKKL